MKEYIFQLSGALYNEETGEAIFHPIVDGELIRCKDCKYNKGEVNKKGFRICSANGMDITDYDYCSWGERQEKNLKKV